MIFESIKETRELSLNSHLIDIQSSISNLSKNGINDILKNSKKIPSLVADIGVILKNKKTIKFNTKNIMNYFYYDKNKMFLLEISSEKQK